jgi:type IX secretion system PorP/SprF family membrane protein
MRVNDTTPYYKPSVTVSMFNHFYENPGFCGLEQRLTINEAFRYEIPFFTTDDKTYHPYNYFVSVDGSLGKKGNFGIGVCFSYIKSGFSEMYVLNHSFSYKIQIGRYNNLRIGIGMEYFQYSLNWEKLTFPDMIDRVHGFVFQTAELLPGEPTKRNIDFNAGLTFSRKKFYFGFSVINITKPDISFISLYRIPRHFIISSGYTFKFNEKAELSPSAELRFIDKEFTGNFHVTGLFWKHFIAGFTLNELKTPSIDLGFNFWNIMTFYASCGVSADSELFYHFGPLDYASANLRLQFGKYQEKF